MAVWLWCLCAQLASMVEAYSTAGWATTWDTPIHDNGTLYAPFLRQLRALKPYARRAHLRAKGGGGG